MTKPTGSRQRAQSWVKIYLEVLGVDRAALWRIRGLVSRSDAPLEDEEIDVQLVVAEVERVLGRLNYWEGVVAEFPRIDRR